jgi:RES domain
MIPPPPATFPAINRINVPAATDLHRIHNSSFTGNSFNPCLGRPSRFAPLVRADGTCIPTMYAATSLECAAHETVFHEIQHDAKYKSIGYREIENLDYSIIRSRRDLVLAPLFEPDLNRWELTRRQLIDTFAADYEATAKWAIAIHDNFSDIDGLVWTSRRCDPERAYLLFGDRLPVHLIDPVHRARISETNELLLQIRGFADRANILIAF